MLTLHKSQWDEHLDLDPTSRFLCDEALSSCKANFDKNVLLNYIEQSW